MEIFVRDVTSSTTLSVNVPSTASVAQLKAKIFAARCGIHVEHQRLIFGHRVLEDVRCLADYQISHESTVVLQYGPKFPFSWKPPPISSAEDFTQPADAAAQRRASVSTVLRGSPNISGNPFAPIRLFVSNAQLSYSSVKNPEGVPAPGFLPQLSKFSQGSLGTYTNLESYQEAWETMSDGRGQWMEFDLMQPIDVAGVHTLGNMSRVTVLFRSSKEGDWRDHFHGKPFNSGRVLFQEPVFARYVRICPFQAEGLIRMRADILVFPGALITPLQCGVLAHSSLAFSHVGSMLFIPQTFDDGTQLCVYHSGSIGLKPWICPSVRFQSSVANVCIAPDQTVYVTDSNKIYRVALEGILENFCGGDRSYIDGSGITAGFSSILGIVAGVECMFVVDQNCIRSVSYSGVVTTIAGHNREVGIAEGIGSSARFNSPRGICLDHRTGVIYVTESHRIRSIVPSNGLQHMYTYTVATVAGTDKSGFSEGIGTAATFSSPQGIAVVQGFLFVCDTGNHCIRRIAPNGQVSIAAGCAMTSGHVDANLGIYAQFESPANICVGENDALYISSSLSHGGSIRKFYIDDLISLDLNGRHEILCNFPSDIQGSLHSLSSSAEHQQLCDWTVHTGTGTVFACSAIVKLRCPALASKVASFKLPSTAEQQQIRMTGISRTVLQMLVDYIHSDMLSMPLETKEDVENAVMLLKTSSEFALPRLKIAISRRLHRCISCDNVCHILMAAEQHEAPELRSSCLEFAIFNFALVRSSAGFAALPMSTIMDIVQRISL